MDTLQSYDELPYDSLPLPETQPDFLAALARLHGFDAPDPTCARILELGCASGGNLIPLAWRWSASRCIGVELSRVQAEAGADFIRALGLPNVRIVHGDLAALPADLGEFDYIIAHGVFSWVPPAVQGALLALCRRHLSARGIAYVSFNVAAGWRPLEPLRAALLARTGADLPAPARYEAALQVLDDLEAHWTDPALLKEIAYLRTAAPSYLFHEYLAEFNAPFGFERFAADLDAHGLRYVGEAGPRHAVVEFDDESEADARRRTERWRDAEAALDEALATRFRRALITRADAPADPHPARADALSELAFYADLRCDEDIDLEQATEQAFVNPAGNTFPVAPPVMKAALMVLSGRCPAAVTYADLQAAAGSVMVDCGVAAEVDDAAFRAALFQLVTAHAVTPTLNAGPVVIDPDSHPRANALARLQARSPGWVVSGRRHVAIDLDAAGRALLGLLDGSRALPELSDAMRAWLAAAGVDLPEATVDELTARQVWLFARQGLLEET